MITIRSPLSLDDCISTLTAAPKPPCPTCEEVESEGRLSLVLRKRKRKGVRIEPLVGSRAAIYDNNPHTAFARQLTWARVAVVLKYIHWTRGYRMLPVFPPSRLLRAFDQTNRLPGICRSGIFVARRILVPTSDSSSPHLFKRIDDSVPISFYISPCLVMENYVVRSREIHNCSEPLTGCNAGNSWTQHIHRPPGCVPRLDSNAR